jgi:hypothetical protein
MLDQSLRWMGNDGIDLLPSLAKGIAMGSIEPRAGLGISHLPSFFVGEDIKFGRIIMLDLGFEAAPVELWALRSRRREPRPVAVALTSWLAARLGEPPFWEENLHVPGGATRKPVPCSGPPSAITPYSPHLPLLAYSCGGRPQSRLAGA